ncbi:hypothetical protein, partial [Marivita lacus]|uniref:hypothetical protein n=1 Tax=Marivita lacus TaxID=1323742 RepID=UPI001E526FE5
PLGHQLYCLDLELAAELSSRHIQSPIPWSRSYLRVHETGSRPFYTLILDVEWVGYRRHGPPPHGLFAHTPRMAEMEDRTAALRNDFGPRL